MQPDTIRILTAPAAQSLRQIMSEMGVDPYGIDLMVPKAISHLIRINGVSAIAANILKQEMLSLGGDVAVARGALTGRIKKTDCLVMATRNQLNSLCRKLARQPFGLDRMAGVIMRGLCNHEKGRFLLKARTTSFRLDGRCRIMGIVNVTPDSFSGDGLSRGGRADPADLGRIVAHAQGLCADGADMVDVGGESTRPGAAPVSVAEELRRTIPVVKALKKKLAALISIDTSKPAVAERALDCGASLVNDVTGLRIPRMRRIIARSGAACVIMHMQGRPRTMQVAPRYRSMIDDIMAFFSARIDSALEAGIHPSRIMIDPGIGFGKTLDHNLEIIKRLREFKVLGYPILIGPSRKSFIGSILGLPPQERVMGTVSSCIAAAHNGASVVRVHDVKAVKQALGVYRRIEET